MCLSKYEKETILLMSEGDDFYDIQVYDSRLKRRLTDFAAKYPDLCRIKRQDPDGCIFCIIDKSRISIRLIPPYSDVRKNAARENAKKLSERKVQSRILCKLKIAYKIKQEIYDETVRKLLVLSAL